jgi:hypothetical protein
MSIASLPHAPLARGSSSKTTVGLNKGQKFHPPHLDTSGAALSANSRYSSENKSERPGTPRQPSSSPLGQASWKKGGPKASDYAKVGIQMGKTKVFLRHQAFEALERIRSAEQSKAATKLNSLFRRYLARMAYIPYRNAFRMEMTDLRQRFRSESCDFKETKEGEMGDDNGRMTLIRHAFQVDAFGDSLVDKWTESQIRDAIHNPVPRHEWGKQAPSGEATFQWVIDDGLWVKNYNYARNQRG